MQCIVHNIVRVSVFIICTYLCVLVTEFVHCMNECVSVCHILNVHMCLTNH